MVFSLPSINRDDAGVRGGTGTSPGDSDGQPEEDDGEAREDASADHGEVDAEASVQEDVQVCREVCCQISREDDTECRN
jgi:hypothetical protein